MKLSEVLFFRHNNNVNQHHTDRTVSTVKMERRKLGKNTHTYGVSTMPEGDREKELDNE